ncbi:hypothetical protein UNDYM_3588 [Undibacterium sp. YM2]|uniref:hypothetical protein n=1 Tax=Undibacterium sp. YM2 TaxID=2058625 RepID=UPI001331EB71|nr:hypothetical protein [Undibacterium sp. YM2]BBB67841.1 hypothetical protein UNDYM_3588 [Undibacterium sp. YM2]
MQYINDCLYWILNHWFLIIVSLIGLKIFSNISNELNNNSYEILRLKRQVAELQELSSIVEKHHDKLLDHDESLKN